MASLPRVLVITIKRYNTGVKVTHPVETPMSLDNGKYGFAGAIEHYGSSLDTGHYICKTMRGTDMWMFDDKNASCLTPEEAKVDPKNVYMLFYVNKETAAKEETQPAIPAESMNTASSGQLAPSQDSNTAGQDLVSGGAPVPMEVATSAESQTGDGVAFDN